MTTAAPALNTESIRDGVRDLLLRATHFVPTDSLQYRRLLAEANKILKANPAFGHLVIGFVKHVTGDLESVRRHMDNAIRLGSAEQTTKEVALSCFINLGAFTEAKQFFAECATPQQGRFTYNYDKGICCGAFRQLIDFEEYAMKMHLDLEAIPLHEKCIEAVHVLDKTGSTDDEISSLLDIAGEVMRRKNLFFIGERPDLYVIDDQRTGHCVHLTFSIAESPEVVSELMFELAEAAANRLEKIPLGFSVGFSSVAPT